MFRARGIRRRRYSQEITPEHTFSSTNDYIVTLTLTDNDGLQNDATVVISVTESPLAVISATPTSADSAPAAIFFDGTASVDPDGQIVEYQWDFGDGSREYLDEVSTFTPRLVLSEPS